MNIKKRRISERLFDGFNVIFMLFLVLVCIYPLYYVVCASFSEPQYLMTHLGALIVPRGFTLKGYELVFKNPNVISGYRNTIIYMVLGTTINIFMTSLGAFVLSRKNAMLVKPLMVMVVITMYFSGGLIPSYLLIQNLNMYNTIWAMVVPGAISTYNMIVMRTAFMSVPSSLEESARIDGASEFTVLFRIILPLSKATIATMILFYGVGHWNSWFSASIYLKDNDKFPLQLILRQILIQNDTQSMVNAGSVGTTSVSIYQSLIKYCTIIVGTVPILCIYPFLQKYFAKGVMVGSLKE